MPGQVPPHADERTLLLGYVDQQRDGIRFAAFGLTDEQARLTPTAGTLSIGGLVKHVSVTETAWIDRVQQRPPPAGGYGASFVLGPQESLAGTLARLDEVAAATEAAIAAVDLETPVPIPKDVPWFPKDIDEWSVRWVLLHLVEEIARHAGHADIIREHIDGATMYELMAGAEGWPATEWITPWTPPSR